MFLILILGPSILWAYSGDQGAIEPGLKDRKDILFFGGFESQPWNGVWGILWGPSPADDAELTTGRTAFEGHSLRVHYKKDVVGPDGGLQYLMDLTKVSIPPRESAYLRYYVRFDPDFDFVRGGKLPGLVGANANTGGHKPNGMDGWSARMMWRPNGKIVQYVYHPDQPTEYGEDFEWNYGGCPRFFTPGKWQCVETFVQMNTPGKKDGIIRSWLDGEKALEVTNIRFRDTDKLKIDKMYFSTFFGGNDPSWAPPKDEYVTFDNFVIAENYIGPDAQAPADLAVPTVAPTTQVEKTDGLLIYDGDHAGWITSNWSEGKYDFSSTVFNHTPDGSKSLWVELPNGWGGAQFEGPEIKPADYRSIAFWVYPTGCDVEFRARLEENHKQTGQEKTVTSGPTDGLKVKQWSRVEIPLSEFNAPGGFNKVVITSNSAKAVSGFYLDDIYLVK